MYCTFHSHHEITKCRDPELESLSNKKKHLNQAFKTNIWLLRAKSATILPPDPSKSDSIKSVHDSIAGTTFKRFCQAALTNYNIVCDRNSISYPFPVGNRHTMASVPSRRIGETVNSQPVLEARDHDDGEPLASNGSPFYSGATDPDKGGGADGQHTPSAAEIGIIIGVVVLVLVGISALFFMRSRKKKDNIRDAEAGECVNGQLTPDENRVVPCATNKKLDDDGATCCSTQGEVSEQPQELGNRLPSSIEQTRDQAVSPGVAGTL